MGDLAELLMRYGYGQQDPGPDETYDTRNVLGTMQKRAPTLLNRLAGAIPANTEHGLSLANMLKGGLDTAGRWLGGNPEIGKDTLAPLGLAGMGMAMAPRGAIGAMGGGRPASKGGSLFDWSNPGGAGERGAHARTSKVGDTTVMYGVGRDGTAEIISMRTQQAKRGAGSARNALQRFLEEADAMGLEVKLQASPLDRKTSLDGLVKFYESLGFQKTGRTINVAGDPEMVRAARQRPQEP